MPVTNEWSFTAEVATWLTEMLRSRVDLPFLEAKVEIPVKGSQKRHDLIIYGRDGKPSISGELKMPDKANGGTPFNEVVVKDAQLKANALGVEYYFTWNVNRCVFWKTFEQGKSIMERRIEHFDVLPAPIHHTDEVEQPRIQEQIKQFLLRFLERWAAIVSGAQPLQLMPPDELFLTIWEAALEVPVAQTHHALNARYDKDIPFTTALDKWMRGDQGWIISHSDEQIVRDNLERAAKYSCYVLATKIIFYKALRRRFSKMKALQLSDALTSGAELLQKLNEYFEDAMKQTGDYQTVFKQEYGDTLPFLNDAAVGSWRELSKQTDDFDFTQINYEIIGQIFERMLSNGERHKFGQHYTRSEVVDLINVFCIRDANDVVFDPACGGGTFLVRAYARKREMSGGALGHQELLQQIYGLDISKYPAHLTTLNLATRDFTNNANYPLVARQDFFKVNAGDTPFAIPFGGQGGQVVMEPLDKVDAVIGNPPYVRQEKINEYYGKDYKDNLRKQAEADAPGSDLSGRSDILCFFFTHALTYLKRGGAIGLLVSSTWLDTGYGFRLQKFLLDNFEIVAIFESNCEPWFTGARVTTAAVILRHQPDARKRAANRVKFALLTQPLSDLLTYSQSETDRRLTFEQLRDRVENMAGTEEFTICPGEGEPVRVRQEMLHGLRVRIVKQDDLHRLGCLPFVVSEADEEESGAGDANETIDAEDAQEAEAGGAGEWNDTASADKITPRGEYGGYKWGIFLRAPNIFFKLLRVGGVAFRPLGQIARVKRGITSGCDKFFFVKDKTAEAILEQSNRYIFRDNHGIYPEDTSHIRIVEAGDGSSHLIEAKYLEPIAFNLMEVDTAKVDPDRLKKHVLLLSTPKEELLDTHVLKYIEWGEEEGFHQRGTCANRLRWYELPIPERSDAFWTMAQRYRHIVPSNADNLVCNHNLFDVQPSPQFPAEVLTAILNSTIVALCKHQFGRTMGGDPVLKTEVVDVKMMLVPDPARASKSVRDRLTGALASMQKRSIHHLVGVDSSDPMPTGDLAMPDRQELDDAVLELLGIDDAEERECLRLELYAEMTRLYRSIRATEKRMNKFKSQKVRKGHATQQSISSEIWERFETKPELKTLADFAAGHPCETITLPPGKAKAVNNLLAPQSLFVDGQYIALNDIKRVQYAKALSDARLIGAVAIPDDPAVCAAALQQYEEYEQQLGEQFEAVAAEYTADEIMQKRVVHELWRKTRQQTR